MWRKMFSYAADRSTNNGIAFFMKNNLVFKVL